MEVVTFMSANHGAVARIRMPMPSKGGAKMGWNPVLIHATTVEEARQRAEDFYRAEQERFAAMAEGKSRRIEKAAATRAAKVTGASTPATSTLDGYEAEGEVNNCSLPPQSEGAR